MRRRVLGGETVVSSRPGGSSGRGDGEMTSRDNNMSSSAKEEEWSEPRHRERAIGRRRVGTAYCCTRYRQLCPKMVSSGSGRTVYISVRDTVRGAPLSTAAFSKLEG